MSCGAWFSWWAFVLGGALGYVVYDVYRTVKQRRETAAIYRGYFKEMSDD